MPDRNRLRIAGTTLVGVMVGILVVLVLYLLVRTNTLTTEIRTSQKSNGETVRIIKDCTEPEGDCFKEAQSRQADVVGDINAVITLAATCADQPGVQTREDIERCILEELEARR
jgi:hypothetical protein